MTEPVRRLRAVDEIDRLHTLAEKLAERRQPVGVTPSFKIAQVKGVGGAVVHEWEVHVPVCDEYPTAAAAFAAQLDFARQMRTAYPPPFIDDGRDPDREAEERAGLALAKALAKKPS